jgi:hypothetical protein
MLVLAAGQIFAADPRLMNLVMPDATTLAGANVTNAKTTPFGQYVLTQLTDTMAQQIQAFVTATGFDPRQDVSEILAASAGTAANPSGLVLAAGNFPVAQMTAAIAAQGSQLTVQSYGGATLITGGDAKATWSVAFLGTTTAAMGDTASVKAAVDRSNGVNSITPALAAQVQALSTTEDAWAVTNTPISTMLAGLTGPPATATTPTTGATASPISQFGQMFNSIQSWSGGVLFGSNVQITGQAITADAGSAKSIADVITALVSIATMSNGQTAGGQGSAFSSLAQLLKGLTVTASGTTINLAMSVPETQLENVLNSLKTPAAKPAARPAAAPKALAAPPSATPIAVASKASDARQ